MQVKNKWGRSHSKSKEEINEGILQGNQRLLPETPTQRRKPENHAKTAEEKRDTAAARRTELKRQIRVTRGGLEKKPSRQDLVSSLY